MTVQLKNVLGWVLLVGGLALTWYGLASANDVIFQKLSLSPNATWIYLPAALRIIYPLVFRSAGVVGIIVGSVFVVQSRVNDGIIDTTFLAIVSGLAPLIGIGMFTTLSGTKPDLADFKPVHLFALAWICALMNAVCMNIYFALSGALMQPLHLAITIFIGDLAGTLIVLYSLAFALTFFISRRRV